MKTSSELSTYFISHAGAQRKLAFEIDKLLQELERSGVLYERDFPLGSNFTPEIAFYLSATNATICLLTDQFLTSNWCIREFEIAFDLQKLMPVLVDDCDLSLLPQIKKLVDIRGCSEGEILESVKKAILENFVTGKEESLILSSEEILRRIEQIIIRFSDQCAPKVVEYARELLSGQNVVIEKTNVDISSVEQAQEILRLEKADLLIWPAMENEEPTHIWPFPQEIDGYLHIVASRGWELPDTFDNNKFIDRSNQLIAPFGSEQLNYVLLFSLGNLELAKYQYEKAIDHFDKALEEFNFKGTKGLEVWDKYYLGDHRVDALLISKGLAHRRIHQLTKAFEAAKWAVEINPYNSLARNNFGVMFQILKRYKEALFQYEIALEVNPSNYAAAAVHDNRGALYEELGDVTSALENYDRAIEIDENSVARLRRAQLFLKSGRYLRAFKEYNEVIHRMPNSPYAYSERGVMYERLLHKSEKALLDYTHAVELDPTFAVALLNRAMLYYRHDYFKEASSDLQRYIELTKTTDSKIFGMLDFCKRNL